MKRISLFIITTVLLWTGLQAQMFTVSDTTPCFERQRNYFYPKSVIRLYRVGQNSRGQTI